MKQVGKSRSHHEKESPERRTLRSRNLLKLDRFLSREPRRVRYGNDFRAIESSEYDDPVIQRFYDITQMQIQSNPQSDFDSATAFEHFLESYRRPASRLALSAPQKTRKPPGRHKGPTSETLDFKRRFIDLSSSTSLSETAKTKRMARENCGPGASNAAIQHEQVRIRKALQRLRIIATPKRKPKSKK